MSTRARRPALVAAPIVLIALIAAAIIGSVVARGGAWGASSARATAAPSAGTALAVLATLPVKGRAPMTGYVRTARFGAAWLDVDRNGCDTRDDILRRDLSAVSGSRCTVRSGVLHDPYTGATIHFVRGAGTSTAVQIDHVVPLGDAWQTGAQGWSQAKRIDLANDPINLFAVDGPSNEQKSDADAASWLPANRSFRCTYVVHQVGVKHAYGLWVTAAEQAAMRRVLSACPTMRVPVSSLVHAAASGSAPSAPAAAAPSAAAAVAASSAAAARAGSYCSPEGATGRSAAGTALVCRTAPGQAHARWRSPS